MSASVKRCRDLNLCKYQNYAQLEGSKMVWEHNLTRHLLTQDRIWNLKIKNSLKYHLTKHIVSSKIITLEGISWRRQISFFPNWSTHKDQRRIGEDRRLLKDPFLDTHLVQSNNTFKKIKSKERQKNEFPHLVSRYVWQPAAAEREAWCSSCRSAAVNSDFFLRLNTDCWVLKVSRLGCTATPCLFWNFLWMEMQRK